MISPFVKPEYEAVIVISSSPERESIAEVIVISRLAKTENGKINMRQAIKNDVIALLHMEKKANYSTTMIDILDLYNAATAVLG